MRSSAWALSSVVVASVLAGSFSSAPVAHGAIITVYLHSFTFSTNPDPQVPGPNEITINTGDTVQWQLVSGFHNVREVQSNPAVFQSGFSSIPGPLLSNTFNQTGQFIYVCDIHGSYVQGQPEGVGMWGSVTVVPTPGIAAGFALLGLGSLRRVRR